MLRALDLGDPSPAATSVRDAAAFPLSDWSPPGAIRDEQSQAREEYGYAASWALLRGIVRLVGEEGMREVFAAAAAGTTAYPGEAAPERSRLPNDWRRFLDLAQGVDDEASIADLVSAVALDDAERRLLPARAAARGGYADLVAAGGTWAAPVAVRMALDGWRFDDATDAMGEAEAVLTTRDELSALAATEGLDPPAGLETAYQDAESTGELAILGQGATRSLDALRGVAAASAAVEAPRDWATELGLDGADPDANLAAARAAWEAGEVDTAQAQASEAVARLAAAPEAGRSRALVGGGVGLALVLLGILGVVLLRRRGRDARRARAWAAGSRDAGTLPGGAWPYATLRPDGPPAEPPGEPMSGDEGADPS